MECGGWRGMGLTPLSICYPLPYFKKFIPCILAPANFFCLRIPSAIIRVIRGQNVFCFVCFVVQLCVLAMQVIRKP